MKLPSQNAFRRVLRWGRWLLLALTLILVSLAALGQWWLLPRLNDYRTVLADTLTDYLHLPAQIDEISALRDGWWLGLRLRGITLQQPERQAPLAHFSQATLGLDLWASLWTWRPVLDRVRLEGARLSLEAGTDGAWRLLGDADDATTARSLSEVAGQLFALPQLEVVGERLVVRQPSGISLEILHPYLQLQQTGKGQRLAFSADLPSNLGGQIQGLLTRESADGQPLIPDQGNFELRIERINLAGWSLPLRTGDAFVEINGAWRDWQPLQLAGRVRLTNATAVAEPRTALLRSWLTQIPGAALQFHGEQRENAWQWTGNVRLSNKKGQVVAEPGFEFARSATGWHGKLHNLRVEDGLAWATPWLDEPVRRWLVPLDPHGKLPEIVWQIDPKGTDYAATVRFAGLSTQAGSGLPGFASLNGTLTVAPTHGRLELDNQQRVRIATDELLRGPISLEVLAGAVDWRRSAAGEWRLESSGLTISNPDLKGRFWGSVTLPASGEPILDLRGDYREVRVEQVRRYLPAAAMPPKAVAWLDRALLGGRLTKGTLVFRGPLAAFPFDRGEGLFETRFQVEDAVLDYAPGWPKLERSQPTVVFRNRSLMIETETGRLLNAEVEKLSVGIEDLDKAVVRVNGRARGSGATMWRAFQDSPAGRDLGENLPDLRIDGVALLDLDLTIPLDPRPNEIRGRVGLLDNRIQLPAWDIALDRVRGAVAFTDDDLTARDLQALLHKQPIRLDLDLIGNEGQRELQARLRGHLALPDLLEEPPAALVAYLDGKSDWEGVVRMPTQHQRANTPAFVFNLSSNLRGTAIGLPAPLGKSAVEARPFKLSARPAADGTQLVAEVEYSPTTRAVLEVTDFPRQPRFKRGALRIGAGAAKLLDGPGLAVVAHLSRWSPEMAVTDQTHQTNGRKTSRLSAKARGTPDGKQSRNAANPFQLAEAADFLHSVDLQIDELLLGGRLLADVRLQAFPSKDEMRIQATGEGLAGEARLPYQPTVQQPVTVTLQRLRLGPKVAATESAPGIFTAMDPRNMPPLTLSIADFHFDGASLGELRLAAVPSTAGIRLSELKLTAPQQHIEASGEWQWLNGGHHSHLTAALHSDSLGAILNTFGYVDHGVERGKTEANLTVKWNAPLPDIALEQLDGNLQLRVDAGQLRDIKPGLGRLIGMLNIQNLTRRLNFDFSDLFQPGMEFDKISGDFKLTRGSAYTDNLQVEGPAARIEMAGRIGLQARDFDQTITVIPNVGGTLPVAGTIAGGPVVGAAVFVAERLLQKDIEQVTRYRYALTGPWDDPVIEALKKPAAAASSNPSVKGFTSAN